MYMDLYVFRYIFALHVSGAICTHPQEHKLQSTALGVCNGCGMLVHWSRYWLGHPHTFSIVTLLALGRAESV
jgi:phosphoribosylformylglycinamidine (FGAM) synthase-like amidotransferase family enzyme